ncbi:Cof-type HAD-IIB family hydrolase [Aerococcaceae bacterium NML201209]|nr:Cof-type HAD-IIB family hydrolase [Aerococcaceae bacterium NML201209]MDO4775436.1 HAD family hydrolase [Aerococcaceae bacterium]
MKQQFIFLDIDGTLIDYDMTLPDSAVAAIRQARANGHRVIICSGRSKAEIYPYIWEIGLDGYIGGNGSYIEYQGQPIHEQFISADDAKRAIDWLEQRKLGYYLEANSGLYANAYFLDSAATIYGENTPENRQKVQAAFPHMIYNANLYRNDLNKISFRLNCMEDYEAAVRDFPQFAVGLWGGTGHRVEFADFGQKGVHKAKAVDILLEYVGASLEDTIAFGDADVDATMLQHCAIGVAMGNAKDSLKAIADYVTTAVQADGIYKAFQYYQLI